MGSSLKLALVSATVLSSAVMLKLLASFITEFSFAEDAPATAIWTSLISWLKPPYLYVVINCIIITIVASSRLQSKIEDSSPSPFMLHAEPVKLAVFPVIDQTLPQIIHEPDVVPVHKVLLRNEPVKELYSSGRKVFQVAEPDLTTVDDDMKIATDAYEEITKNIEDKSVIFSSSWTPPKINRVDVSFPMEKPPASARFSHRKPTKSGTEGGKTLGVTKPKRQDTLENTWKTITEGRSVPLTRHLKKSDTWETHGHDVDNHHPERMTKSDVNHRKPPPPQPSKLSRSGGSGRLKKEPSLGQEELNRKVEAFIKKFNEDMRLQRQESLNQYMEMINRGAH